jgi:RHS repeat-associated protein
LISYTGPTQSESGSGITYSSITQEPPFGADPNFGGSATVLTQATIGYAQPWQFAYDSAGAGEMQSVIFPFGGQIAWNYSSFAYTGSRSLREVSGRSVSPTPNSTNPTWSYGISRPDAPNSVTIHSAFTLSDASGIGAKIWSFNTAGSPWQLGLMSDFKQLTAANGTVLHDDQYTWSQDPAGRPYISAHTSITDPGTGYAQSALTTQTVDAHGNTTQSVSYPFNNATTPLRTYTNTYLTDSGHLANYVFSLLSNSQLTAGGTTTTLVSNTYWDSVQCNPCFAQAPNGAAPTQVYDSNPPVPRQYRGLLYASTTPAKTTYSTFYAWGTVAQVTGSDGTNVTASADSATNYAAPQTITTQSYTETIGYTSWLGVAQTTGPNGEQLTMQYDTYGRPTSGTSPYGATTTFSYNTSAPFTQTESGPSGVTITTLDGFGRAVLVQHGDSTTPDATTSYTASVYAPCACSPLGKLQKVSMPYPQGGSASAWTVYTYDGLGRTVSVKKPDGASTTNYNYAGNQTTVTDPAGKWKTTTTDVLGNLTTVLEPDPANQPSGTLSTNYTYDWMGHVTQVSMPRGSTTQTRTFVYNSSGQLTSATNPENGTVTYTYNTTGTVATKTDAKNQQTVYTYDSKNRVTEVQRYPAGTTPPNGEDVCQRVTYTYDTNPVNANFSQNSTGRLTTIQYYGQNANSNGQGCGQGQYSGYNYDTFTEMYSYLAAGAVTAKNVGLNRVASNSSRTTSLEVDYTYDNAGRVLTTTYPMTFQNANSAQPVLTTGYDAMGRPSTLTDTTGDPGSSGSYPPTNWVSGVQYDYAGRLTSMSWLWNAAGYGGNTVSESRTYNVNGQLASIYWPSSSGVYQIQYSYSATQNNGQITQEIDNGTLTTSYQYDALSRLASSSGGVQGTQTFQYDGFGNLTAKVLNGTTTPIPVNAATNQLSNAYYDANGNMTSGAGATFNYDEANRVTTVMETSGGAAYYGYDASNKRIYQRDGNGNETFTFVGAKGENLGKYGITWGMGYPNCPSYGFCFQPQMTSVRFAGRLVAQTAGTNPPPVYQDRLGTNRATGNYYPFGDGAAGTDNIQFATYTRDSYSGIDYADQRFYASSYARYVTPDPAGSVAASASDPGSWNRYAYTRGDPVNRLDPSGMDDNFTGGGGYGCEIIFADASAAYNLNSYCSGGGQGSCPNFDPNVMMALQNSPDAPTFYSQAQVLGCAPYAAALIPVAVAAPPPTCGQVNPDGTSAEQTELAVLFGEDSWSLGYSPTSVASEDQLMINVMVNQTIESHGADTQAAVAAYITKYATRFLGFAPGQANLDKALSSSLGSSACQHLIEAEGTYTQFWSAGGAPQYLYNQWRSNGTVPTQGLIMSSLTVAGTTFYDILPLPKRPVIRPRILQ